MVRYDMTRGIVFPRIQCAVQFFGLLQCIICEDNVVHLLKRNTPPRLILLSNRTCCSCHVVVFCTLFIVVLTADLTIPYPLQFITTRLSILHTRLSVHRSMSSLTLIELRLLVIIMSLIRCSLYPLQT